VTIVSEKETMIFLAHQQTSRKENLPAFLGKLKATRCRKYFRWRFVSAESLKVPSFLWNLDVNKTKTERASFMSM